MINTVKNIKWIALTSFLCIAVGILTFFTFINQSFIELNDFNLQLLLIVDLILLMLLSGGNLVRRKRFSTKIHAK